ncbi:efflux RND transporter periplasmic adaptor subunit [Shinella zoogloeoides]|uniref:efflux RND transporter periplasmic adaptor subunit n=1 Tax=Shinella zoogloeoides TaxID=352475 RepID=UPI000E652E53|nr:efflux RND transporter periplasmic adaptor subunit [Shinella zoogloeoides]
MMRERLLRIGLVAAGLLLAACSDQSSGNAPPGGGAMPAAEVGFVVLKAQSVPRHAQLSGRVVAHATAEIRPQIDGIIQSIDFREGRKVDAGDVLFKVRDAKFSAAYAAAAASLSRAEASQQSAQAAFDRNARLQSQSAVSQQALDEATAALLQAKADVEAAKASLETARIDLDNTTIKAPIAGIIGMAGVSVGSLVTQNQTDALATIRQIDPVNVDLVDTSANLLKIRQDVEAGRLGRDGEGAPSVRLTLENGADYDETGTISLATVNVSESTGTFTLRASFPNTRRVLLPGMFVRASVDLGSMPNAFLVPQRAVQRSGTGEPVAYVVSADGKAEQRTLTTLGTSGNDWIVTEGLKDGERLIVDGFQKISAGAAVTPVEAVIDEDGVVKQSLAGPATTDDASGASK